MTPATREAPATEAGVGAVVAAAHASGTPLAIEGRGTRAGLLRPVQAARTLSLANLSGITLYRPSELILSARAGTPLPEIEAALAAGGQHLIAEPPHLTGLFGTAGPPTIGGTVSANLSGPRRIASGAMRDHVMGIRAVDGRGEVFHSGGRVLKNVTGLDLCKLLTGAHGTLGVLTEITLKVLPAPPDQATIAVPVADWAAGVAVLSAGLGSPYGVSGAALLAEGDAAHGLAGAHALLRIEDFSGSVAYRAGRLAAGWPEARRLDAVQSAALWRDIREAVPLAAAPGDAVWRIVVRPSRAAGIAAALRAAFAARLLLDWGGGLIWVAGPATAAAHAAVVGAATAARGGFTLFRAPDPLRAAVAVLPPEAPALGAIAARVKAVMDPGGILNPGRMRAGV